MHCIIQPIILFFILFIPSLSIASTVYKWTDETGEIHYSSTPPQGTLRENTEKLNIKAPGRSSTPVKDQDKKPFDKSTEKKSETRTPKERLIEDCMSTQKNITVLQNEGVISIREDDGETRTLSQEERDKNETQNKQFFEDNCKDLPEFQ